MLLFAKALADPTGAKDVIRTTEESTGKPIPRLFAPQDHIKRLSMRQRSVRLSGRRDHVEAFNVGAEGGGFCAIQKRFIGRDEAETGDEEDETTEGEEGERTEGEEDGDGVRGQVKRRDDEGRRRRADSCKTKADREIKPILATNKTTLLPVRKLTPPWNGQEHGFRASLVLSPRLAPRPQGICPPEKVARAAMGTAFSKTLAKMFGSKEMRILMLGLDNAGKTSILFLQPPAGLDGVARRTEDLRSSAFAANCGVRPIQIG
ncbi:MAG: hypothetical protein BJ554DRAFT_1011 [Olpidium bornovanus]|uniref:ADP-ribosylation factor n=1 Tax=Olpidium bornovanus TaxID=278681 RepID=A0A8H7ZT25_9FUNG|nr:MAG: hypothetical protein BJ554DRAFT_1011 [Olpidium bornovanus]